MPIPVKIPKLGMTMTEATILRWLVAPGERVALKQPLVEIETEKIVSEVEAPAAGVLSDRALAEGQVGAVAQTIAWILVDGEAADGVAPISEQPSAPVAFTATRPVAPLPRPGDSFAVGAQSSPAVRRFARELGVDLSAVTGTGPGGRIVKEDVLRGREQAGMAPQREDAIEPLSAMRRAIVATVVKSAAIPQIVLYASADVSRLVALHKRDETIAYDDVLILAVARTLLDHKYLNGSYEDAGIRLNAGISIGLAVTVDNGLLIPVVRDAARLSLKGIGAAQRLVDLVRSRQVTEQDMAGGTFTITNLGMFPVDRFTALIVPPQAAILSVGRIEHVASPDPAGTAVFRPRMTLGLSVDHRVADGAAGGAFLRDLIARLEHFDCEAL